MDSTQNIISFCTGYGGIKLGLKLAGLDVRTVAYVEIEAFACANLVAKIEQGKMDAAPIWTDIKTYPASWFFGKVHGFVSGYPCQPFSNAGKRTDKADPRYLWPYILKYIGAVEPLWCFFENVGGHTSLGFKEVSESLRNLGYAVEAGLFTATEVGAPHKRERLFILAYRDGFKRWTYTSGRNDETKTRSGSEKLDNSIQRRYELENQEICTGRNSAINASELANPEHNGLSTRKGPGSISETVCNTATGTNHAGDASGTSESGQLAKPNGQCKQRVVGELADTQERQEPSGPIRLQSRMWPARPGQEQYEWEEPRTIESGMGRTVDGFKSRVDQLRLLGNGVVPQTAELAWKTLTEMIKC